ncbi:MAG: zf-HC2 domain-containing protein [Planctomycetota bacterium]
MQCEEAKAVLPLVADASLPAVMQAPVDQHLADCASCREQLAVLEQVRCALQDVPPAAASEPCLIELAATRRRRSQRLVLVLTSAAAALLFGVLLAATTGLRISLGSHTLALGPAVDTPLPEASSARVRELARAVEALSARVLEQAAVHERDLVRLARAIDQVRGLDHARAAAPDLGDDRQLAAFAAQIISHAPMVDVPGSAEPSSVRPLKKNH